MTLNIYRSADPTDQLASPRETAIDYSVGLRQDEKPATNWALKSDKSAQFLRSLI